jgi:hypothetical protein
MKFLIFSLVMFSCGLGCAPSTIENSLDFGSSTKAYLLNAETPFGLFGRIESEFSLAGSVSRHLTLVDSREIDLSDSFNSSRDPASIDSNLNTFEYRPWGLLNRE